MSDWEKRLLAEANEIRHHGHGKLEFQAQEYKGEFTKITILAGKAWQFIVKKIVRD